MVQRDPEKTGIAKAMHSLSPRSVKPFGEFNCAEFASGDPLVVLGKLFGYGKDSGITGIDKTGQTGILEEFNGGTIFLDEVEVLSHQAQQLLLLPLEGRPFNPAAGKGKSKTTNARFIFATNEPLDNLVKSKKMRADFLRRICERGVINIPPLKDRMEDIKKLALHFLNIRNINSETNLSLSNDSLNIIKKYQYHKYNISELIGVINQSFDQAIFDESNVIDIKHLPINITSLGYGTPDNTTTAIFDQTEQKELLALRNFNFNITRAEKALSYLPGSKMLTNRFRGIIYRTLENSNWNVDKTIKRIAGFGTNSDIEQKINRKINDYIANTKDYIANNSTNKIFVNLLSKYHNSADAFIDAVNNRHL